MKQPHFLLEIVILTILKITIEIFANDKMMNVVIKRLCY